MIQSFKGFLNRSASQDAPDQAAQLSEEIRTLEVRLNEYAEKTVRFLEEFRGEQAVLIDELVQQMHASQQEIIENLTLQLQAAEVLRQEQTEQIDTLTKELAATREQLAELIELQKQSLKAASPQSNS